MLRIGNILNVWKYRELLAELTKREIKARYKQSILGYAWVVLVPLIHLSVMTIVFSFLIRIPTGNVPYPLFLFVALVPWMFTTNAVSAATGSPMANSQLITKIYLPREVFPLSSVFAKMVDMALAFIILALIMIYFGQPLHLTIAFLPIIIAVQVMLILGISFILSAINVFFRDVENILGVFLMVWMYMTPIFYPPELIPSHLTPLFNLNPMMGIINAYRNVVLYGVAPAWPSFIYSALLSAVVFLAGFAYYRNRSRYFADVI